MSERRTSAVAASGRVHLGLNSLNGFQCEQQHILGAIVSTTKKMREKREKSTATVLKSVASFSNLLPTPATFIGFARTVKIHFVEMIGLA